MASLQRAENEFSRMLSREELGWTTRHRDIVANVQERAALAARFGLLALDALSAELTLRPRGSLGLVELTGRIKAQVTQSCVVTLEPVPGEIDETISLLYSLRPEDQDDEAVDFDPEGDDPPEAIGPDGIDLGETIAQQLAVLLEPYPRAVGAELPEAARPSAEELRKSSPFAVLKELKS